MTGSVLGRENGLFCEAKNTDDGKNHQGHTREDDIDPSVREYLRKEIILREDKDKKEK
jgi:hypothetical protein